MGAQIATALPDGASWERREPARSADLAGDVIVPFLQSIITGGVGTTVGALVAGWPGGIIAGGLAFSVSWTVLLMEHPRTGVGGHAKG